MCHNENCRRDPFQEAVSPCIFITVILIAMPLNSQTTLSLHFEYPPLFPTAPFARLQQF